MLKLFPIYYRLIGLVVKASDWKAEDPGLIPACAVGTFPGRVKPVTEKSVLEWLPYKVHGDIGPALGLVGPVSAICDLVR